MLEKSTNTVQPVGHFDYIEDDYAYGWALNPTSPLERVNVEILCDGKVVGHGSANGYRQDLVDAGIGDGNHLFRIKLSYELFDGEVHSLQARNTSNNMLLAGSNIVLPPQLRPIPYPLISRGEGEKYLSELCSRLPHSPNEQQKKKINQAYQIGSLLQETGALTDARYAWESLARVLGENAFCSCKIAESYLLEEKPLIALDFYHRAAGLSLLFNWSHLGISTCQRVIGNHEAAEDALVIADSLPKTGRILDHLQSARLKLLPSKIDRLVSGEKESEAINLLYQVLESHPHDEYAKLKLDLLIGQELKHSGTKATESILIAHQRALRLLEMAIESSSINKDFSLKTKTETDTHHV